MSLIKIIKADHFDTATARHKELMNSPEGENAEYKERTGVLRFPKGKKLLLEIEVTDEDLSSGLYNFLFDRVEGQELLGFKLLQIVHPENNQTIQMIDQLIQQLQKTKTIFKSY